MDRGYKHRMEEELLRDILALPHYIGEGLTNKIERMIKLNIRYENFRESFKCTS